MNRGIGRVLIYFLIGAGTSGLCLWQLHGGYGFNLADEGFFWYGAKQTAKGEVPGLDFMSYEPGRYYWAAAMFKTFGNDSNHMARVASVLFGAMLYGMISSVLIGKRNEINGAGALLSVVFLNILLGIWSFPYYRVTDAVAPCLSYLLCYHQYVDRRLRTSLSTGLWIGIMMFFGRNHALYALISVGIIIGYVQLQDKEANKTLRRVWLGTLGMMSGMSPFLIITLFRPGYPTTIVGQWFSMLKAGKTNLLLPWPLPWQTIKSGMPLSEVDGHLIVGIMFISLFGIAIGGTAMIAFKAVKGKLASPELAAMTAATTGYVHYCIERADMEHIGPVFMPVLLGIFLWGIRRSRAITAICICSLLVPTLRVAARQQSAYHCIRETIDCTILNIDSYTQVSTDSATAAITIRALEEIKDVRFLALPAYPSLYAAKDAESPIWDIYAAWPRTEKEQKEAITRIEREHVAKVILNKDAFGKEASLDRTNKYLYDFLKDEYRACEALIEGKMVLVCEKGGNLSRFR
jgi:hypothetical protein